MTEREERELREKIFGLVREFYALKHKEKDFTPGKTPIRYGGRVFDEDELIHLVDSSLDFWLTTGRYADLFEREFAKVMKVRHAMLCNSGSSANLLAVAALTSIKLGERRLQPGDEVITIATGFPSTLNPIIQNGLVPVFIDVRLGTYNADMDELAKAISPRTKAIIFAHTLGNPFDLDGVLKIAQQHNLWLIEDNCDALGSTYRGQWTGSFGHLATVSFYPAHHITMGEGGCVLTSDPKLAELVESFRDWGRDCWCDPGNDNTCGKRFQWQLGGLPGGYDHKYIYSHIGYNLKLTDMQAAVGLAQLKKLPHFVQSRKQNWHVLYKGLEQFQEFFILPEATAQSDPSWFGFPLSVRSDAPFNRREVTQYLESKLIATRLLFGGNLVRQPAYQSISKRIVGELSNSDFVMNQTFWIGVYPGLTGEMLDYVIEQFGTFCKSYA